MDVHFLGSRGPFGHSAERLELERGYKHRKWKLATKVVYPGGVEWAIKTFEPYKAPGIDAIYSILLQEGLNCLLGPLTQSLGQALP
jgi:hypothetical protein